MSQTTVNLGYVPKNRGEYSSTASYYKDNIVQYNGSSYICNPPNYDPDTAPTASITGVAPYASDPAVPNTGWAVFSNDSSGVGEGVYDVSVDHTTDNQPKKYADLSAALQDVPQAKQKGGMTIRFIQSYDNKYVQYRLVSDEFTTDTTQWAVDDVGVYVDNPEFVYVKTDAEGKILWAIKIDGGIYYGAGCPQQVKDYIEEKISSLSLDEYEDIVAFLSDYLGSDTTLKTLLDSKLDAEGLDPDALGTVQAVENPEFIEVTTDNSNRILEGITEEGVKHINIPIETKHSIVKCEEDAENRIEIYQDKEGRILQERKEDGTLVENANAQFCGDLEVEGDLRSERLDEIEASIPPIIPAYENMELNINSSGFDNIINSWWFYPMAISDESHRRSLYFGYLDKEGYSGVAKCDLSCKTPVINKTILKRESADTHDSVSVSMLEDGRILAVYPTGHATRKRLYVRRSVQMYSIKDMETLAEIKTPDTTSYSQVHHINGKWYIFFRGPIWKWLYTSSEDLVNWSEPEVFLWDSNDYQRYLLLKPIEGDSNKLRFITYSNPSYQDTNIRCGYIDFENGNIYNIDGTIVGDLNGNVARTGSLTVLVQQPSGTMRNRMFDLAVTDINTVEFCYCSFDNANDSAGTDSVYYVYKDGNISTICNGGLAMWIPKSQSGMVFIDEDTLVVGRGDTTDGCDYIEIYSQNSGVWNKTKEVYKESRGTDPLNLIRNGYVTTAINGKFIIWFRGYYHDYGVSGQNEFIPSYCYDMDAVIYDVDKDKLIY